MTKRITAAACLAITALSIAGCAVTSNPDGRYDYSKAGFASDDGVR